MRKKEKPMIQQQMRQQDSEETELYSELDEEIAVAAMQDEAESQATEDGYGNGNEEAKAIKKKVLLFSPFFLFALVFFATFLTLCATDDTVIDQPVVSTPKVIETEKKVTKHTIVQQEVFYAKCSHTIEEKFQDSPQYLDKTYEQLEAEGWRVEEVGSQKIRIMRDEKGFCPADAEKRTIRRTVKGIGIYEGPKTADGKLMFEMDIDFSQLPEDWQQILSQQTEEAAIEFANEDELQAVLENLDELTVDNEMDESADYNYWERDVV